MPSRHKHPRQLQKTTDHGGQKKNRTSPDSPRHGEETKFLTFFGDYLYHCIAIFLTETVLKMRKTIIVMACDGNNSLQKKVVRHAFESQHVTAASEHAWFHNRKIVTFDSSLGQNRPGMLWAITCLSFLKLLQSGVNKNNQKWDMVPIYSNRSTDNGI